MFCIVRRKSDGRYWRNRKAYNSFWRAGSRDVEWTSDPTACRPYANARGARQSFYANCYPRPKDNNWTRMCTCLRHPRRHTCDWCKKAKIKVRATFDERYDIVPIAIQKESVHESETC